MRASVGWRDVDAEGRKVEVTAERERNEWVFRRRRNRRHDWERIDSPSVGDWRKLLDHMERTYQRRGCAWRDVEQVRDFLLEAEDKEPNP